MKINNRNFTTYSDLKIVFVFICICFFSIACSNEENEDKTKEIDKDGALESAIQVTHIDSLHDVVTTTYSVWEKGIQTKQISHSDTIPSLGYELKIGSDDNENELQAKAPKDYEIFITVK
jgi:hypothetical protein